MKDTCIRRILVSGKHKQRRRRRRRQRERQKINRFRLEKQQLCMWSRFFVDFFAVVARLRRETPNFTFYGGWEHMYNNEFLFFCEFRYSPLELIQPL